MAQISTLHLLLLMLITLSHYAPHVTGDQTKDPTSPPVSPRVHHGGKSNVSPTMAIILVCLISAFFLTCFFSIYVHQCVNRQLSQTLALTGRSLPWREEEATRGGLDPRVIASFPIFIYSEIKQLKIGQHTLECAVCLNEFEDEEALQLLPWCWHVFHPDCIQSWLHSHMTCPVCRANLVPQPGQTHEVPVLSHGPRQELEQTVPETDETIVCFQSSDEITAVDPSPIKTFFPRSTSRKERRYRPMMRKSLSTGHSLVLPVEKCERFTLRLPDEVRSRLVNTSLQRARSYHIALPSAKSERKGFRSTSDGGAYDRHNRNERAQRWVFIATPPFFSRDNSSRKPMVDKIIRGRNIPNNDVEIGERSTDMLVLDNRE